MGLISKAQKLSKILKTSPRKPISFVLEQFLLDTCYPIMLCSMLDFPENERDDRKLKKVQELVQHFCEQCRHYVPKENITYKSIEESLRSINETD